MSLTELDKFVKDCEKIKKQTDKGKEKEEEKKLYLKLKEKFEGKKN